MRLYTAPPQGVFDLTDIRSLSRGLPVYKAVKRYFESAIYSIHPHHQHKRMRQAEALFLYSGCA